MDRGWTKVEGQRSVDKTGWIEDGQKWKDKGVWTKQDGSRTVESGRIEGDGRKKKGIEVGQKRKYRGYSQKTTEDGQKTKDRRCRTKEEGWRSEKK